MPQRRAAKKDLRQNKKKQQRNLQIKRTIKSAVKSFKNALAGKDKTASQNALNTLYKALDKAAGQKTIHKNKAARKKSRFSKLLRKETSK